MGDRIDIPGPALAGNAKKQPAARPIWIAADHGGFELKTTIAIRLRDAGCHVIDFGSQHLMPDDDYPDYVIPLARSVADGALVRGIAICGSGVGAAVVANKVNGIRACLITDPYSAHQGVEHDDLNIIYLGGSVGRRPCRRRSRARHRLRGRLILMGTQTP